MASSASERNTDAAKHYGEAVRLFYEGKYDKAGKALVELRDKHPELLQMLSRVEVFLRVCERKQDNGRAAAKAKPGDLYVIGLVEHNRGKHAEALEIWEEALKKSPTDGADIHLAMAAGLSRQGKAGDALKHLKKSIELDSSNRLMAANDPDFEPLHRNDEFLKLVRRPGRK